MSERADPSAKLSKLPWKDKIGSFLMRRCGLYGLADWMVFQTPDAQAYYSKDIQKKSSIIPNPLDVMTFVALQKTKLHRNKVIGMAGILDTARYRTFL